MITRSFWLSLIMVPAAGIALVVTLGRHVIVRQHRTQMDMNSGRIRTIEREFWKVTEGSPKDTWVTEALLATRKQELPPSWKGQGSETDTLFGKTFSCKPGGPVSAVLSGSYYRHRFTPEALAIIADALLRFSDGNFKERQRWRLFEHAIETAVRETPDDSTLDATWVRATRERTIGPAL